MLRTDGEADCALVDALVSEFRLRELRVGGGGRVDYQRLDVGYVGQQRENLQRVDELEGLFPAPFDLKGKDGAAAARELLQVGLVIGMACK